MSSSMLFTLYFCFKLRTSICLDLIRCILYSFLFYFYTSFLFLWLICWQYFLVLLLHPNSRLTFLTQDNDTLRRNKSFSFRWISQAVNSLFCVNHIWINRLWMARIFRALFVTSFLLLTKLPCLKNQWIACLETVHQWCDRKCLQISNTPRPSSEFVLSRLTAPAPSLKMNVHRARDANIILFCELDRKKKVFKFIDYHIYDK